MLLTMQVYDLRMVPRMTSSFAFNSGPAMLKFHPKLSSTLLVASARGVFTLADANGAAYSRYEQVRATCTSRPHVHRDYKGDYAAH